MWDRLRFSGATRVIITYWGPLARSFYLHPTMPGLIEGGKVIST